MSIIAKRFKNRGGSLSVIKPNELSSRKSSIMFNDKISGNRYRNKTTLMEQVPTPIQTIEVTHNVSLPKLNSGVITSRGTSVL